MFSAKPDHFFEETVKLPIFFQTIPVQPGYLIILTVRVIISKTGVTKLIPGKKHRRSAAAHQRHAGIFYHLEAQFLYLRIRCLTFCATVPATIIVTSICIVPTIIFVVLFVIGIKVPKRKTIVTGKKIDRRVIALILTGIEICRTCEPVCCCFGKPVIALQETPYIIPVLPVPFCPT